MVSLVGSTWRRKQLKSPLNNARTFYFSSLQRVWLRPPRQAVWARPNPSWNIWKTLPRSWEHAVPAVMKANVSPPAVFTSTPAAADYGAHQTLTRVCEQQLRWQNAGGCTSVQENISQAWKMEETNKNPLVYWFLVKQGTINNCFDGGNYQL